MAAGKNYKIISGKTIEELESEVKSKLDNGWILIGGPFVPVPRALSVVDQVYCQAMHKK